MPGDRLRPPMLRSDGPHAPGAALQQGLCTAYLSAIITISAVLFMAASCVPFARVVFALPLTGLASLC
jgi:hypothetical protein